MTAIEHQQLKGITVRNFILTIASTISIVVSIMTTYFNLKADISDVKAQNEITNRVTDLRLKTLEVEFALLQADVDRLKEGHK